MRQLTDVSVFWDEVRFHPHLASAPLGTVCEDAGAAVIVDIGDRSIWAFHSLDDRQDFLRTVPGAESVDDTSTLRNPEPEDTDDDE